MGGLTLRSPPPRWVDAPAAAGMLACTPWSCSGALARSRRGDKVWRHSWISREAADCKAHPQRLLSLFLHCLALPNYVSESFCFDANHLCKELENNSEKDTPARTVCPWLGTMPPLMGFGMEPSGSGHSHTAGLRPTAQCHGIIFNSPNYQPFPLQSQAPRAVAWPPPSRPRAPLG